MDLDLEIELLLALAADLEASARDLKAQAISSPHRRPRDLAARGRAFSKLIATFELDPVDAQMAIACLHAGI